MSTTSDSKQNPARRCPTAAINRPVTRNKSAEMRHNLRDKEKTMKNISRYTQLLKSPTSQKTKETRTKIPSKPSSLRTKKVEVKQKKERAQVSVLKQINVTKPIQKTVKKSAPAIEEQKEYYPQTLKRKLTMKKVYLRPKQELKLIGKTNKRKWGIPHKDMKPCLQQTLPCFERFSQMSVSAAKSAELSMEEIIRLTEDTQDLTDEDFMEILNCPSPVWWEDPPHESYMEDAVGVIQFSTKAIKKETRLKDFDNMPKSEQMEIENSLVITSEGDSVNIKDLVVNKCDDKFLKKRSKLESVLGNLKSKVITKDVTHHSDNTGCEYSKEAANVMNLNVDQPRLTNVNQSCSTINNTMEKSDSTEDDVYDITSREDEILKDLENIEIPVEEDIYIGDRENEKTDDLAKHSCDLNIKDIETHRDTAKNNFTNKSIDTDKLQSKEADFSSPLVGSDNRIGDDDTDVPMILSQNAKFPIISTEVDFFSSPVSSHISETVYTSSCVSNNEGDTISATNICFITDEEDSNVIGHAKINNNSIKCDKSNTEPDNKQCFRNEKEGSCLKSIDAEQTFCNSNEEYVTVYKIVCNDTENENIKAVHSNSDDAREDKTTKQETIEKIVQNGAVETSKDIESFAVKGKINNFYKKCKNLIRKKSKADVKKPAEDAGINSEINKDEAFFRLQENSAVSVENVYNEKENCKSFCDACNPNKEPIILCDNNDIIKYCHKCSCIFDTDKCNYCMSMKSNDKSEMKTLLCFCGKRSCCATSFKNHSFSHEHNGGYKCAMCDFNATTKQAIKNHINQQCGTGLKKPWDHCYAQNNGISSNGS